MKRPVYNARRGAAVDSTMTPMIDVIFQLQIFFLCTAGFALPESILPTQLPDTGAAESKIVAKPLDMEIVRIQLRGQGAGFTVELNQRRLTGMDELLTKLETLGAVSSDLPVVLDIGPEVMIENVVKVFDRCLAAGLRKINFAANQ